MVYEVWKILNYELVEKLYSSRNYDEAYKYAHRMFASTDSDYAICLKWDL